MKSALSKLSRLFNQKIDCQNSIDRTFILAIDLI